MLTWIGILSLFVLINSCHDLRCLQNCVVRFVLTCMDLVNHLISRDEKHAYLLFGVHETPVFY